ncbi:hypothetical protein Hanom_Chr01g00071291 [Helianthus anomalus]
MYGESNSIYSRLNMKENTSTNKFQERSTISRLDDSKNGQQLACVPPNQLHSGVDLSRSSMLTILKICKRTSMF